jgi:pimeloyl-ACP methyl ester carboxylesterase
MDAKHHQTFPTSHCRIHTGPDSKRIMTKLLLWALLAGQAAGLFFNAPSRAQTKAPPENIKLLILPGFGNDSVDYKMPKSLVESLQERGWKLEQISVLPVQRSDWLQVFLRGALDWEFWAGNAAPTRPAFRWYLERISEQVANLTTQDNEQVILVGHSAGGWLGRAAIGFGSEDVDVDVEEDAPPVDLSKVAGIVTLGAPHLPPPPGVMDMTRGALRITNERFPGAYHAPNMFYVTAIGLAVTGKKQERTSPLEPTSVSGFAFNSYEAVCGDGTAIGDGVVPLCAGHLKDALQVSLRVDVIGPDVFQYLVC